MSYSVCITETNVAWVTFDSKEEAEEWMAEPDYDYVSSWQCVDSEMELSEV